MTEPTDADPDAPAASRDALAAREPGQPAAPATALLATRRVELGLSFEDVASQLKFSPRLIEALEAGQFDKLPGRTFARGMMRSYARLLKLDPEPLLSQLADSGEGAQTDSERAVSLRAPIPFSEGGRHVNLVYTVLSVVMLAVVAYFAFDWFQEKGGSPKLAFVAPGQELAPAPVAPPAQESDSRPAEAAPGVPATASRDPKASTFASVGPAPVPETAQRAEEKKPEQGAAAPLAAGRRRIVIQFDKEAWVEVKGRNGVTLLSQLNPAGSEKVIDGEPPFQLTIGNAPSVRVTYNDQPVDLKPHFKVDVARLTLN